VLESQLGRDGGRAAVTADAQSRPLRLAARLRPDAREAALADRFGKSRVAVRLDPALDGSPDARTIFLAVVNQILRFCPHVLAAADDPELLAATRSMATAIVGTEGVVTPISPDSAGEAGVIVNIGVEAPEDPSWVTVNSAGWVARLASGVHGAVLPWSAASSNSLGALAAACLGAGEAFFAVAGMARPSQALELSLFEGRTARPGMFDPGPKLPADPVELDGLLIGCGGVANGWADAIRRLPIRGRLGAVDRQALKTENIGPYVLSRLADLGRPKAQILADALAPEIEVAPYAEEFELFKLRLGFGLALPPLVVGGLDDVETRHSVQRLWPMGLVDMGAGGTTAQVLLHFAGKGGQCLLGALTLPPDAEPYAERVARLTGLRPSRVAEGPTTRVTAGDVAAAPPELREELEAARRRGQLLCGRITERNLFGEEASDDFAPAAPFVSALAGTIGAAETMKILMGLGSRSGLHEQYDFLGARGRALVVRCSTSCECRLRHEEGA
jgi:molybdopterin/thiamine biosynthesis adenylyltransferase